MPASAEAQESENKTVSPEQIALHVSDRCDACGAQAYIRVVLPTGELLFCAHHGNENKAKLEPIALTWHDESSKLNASK
ncbi:MAG: hypothetical protein RLZZ626_232 [Actinomycetota bacterium]|jgi:hypothetical protein